MIREPIIRQAWSNFIKKMEKKMSKVEARKYKSISTTTDDYLLDKLMQHLNKFENIITEFTRHNHELMLDRLTDFPQGIKIQLKNELVDIANYAMLLEQRLDDRI